MTAAEARAAVLNGKTIRTVVGSDPSDPTLLHYLDREVEFDFEPMIYTESIAGWSEGVKEAICEPDSLFYLKFLADIPPENITVTDETPQQRRSKRPVKVPA